MENALVILCGGDSSRMGSDKALLPFGNCCMVEYLVHKFEPYFSKIYLSVKQKGIYSHLHLNVQEISDIYLNAGPLAGVFSTLSMIDEERAFYISIDTPFFDPKLAAHLLEMSASYDICTIQRKEDETEQILSTVYSKSCITKLGKCLLLRQYSIKNVQDKCKTLYVPQEDLDFLPPLDVQFFELDTRASYYQALQYLHDLEGDAIFRATSELSN